MHLITGTNVGGAEAMLCGLLSEMDRHRFKNIVYSMLEPGPTAEKIRALGVEVKTLSMTQGVPDLRAVLRLARDIRQWKPDVLQTWMYHADLLGGLVGQLLCGIPVIWGIHHSNLDRDLNQWMTIGVARLCSVLSRWIPSRIVCCAESSRAIHVEIGYLASRMIVIPNGFDLLKHRPRPDSRSVCATRFKIPADVDVISLIARYHPQKGHATFISAAKLCRSSFPEARYVLCGDGITPANRQLMGLIRDAAMEDRVVLAGRCEPDDVDLLMSRSSVTTTSSSWGEAFPMAVGEAMGCGTACVVTDVGDSAYLVGDTGIVVPPRDPEALASAWMRLLSMSGERRIALGKAARQRIEMNFSLSAVTSRYQSLYTEIASGLGLPILPVPLIGD